MCRKHTLESRPLKVRCLDRGGQALPPGSSLLADELGELGIPRHAGLAVAKDEARLLVRRQGYTPLDLEVPAAAACFGGCARSGRGADADAGRIEEIVLVAFRFVLEGAAVSLKQKGVDATLLLAADNEAWRRRWRRWTRWWRWWRRPGR